MTFPSNSLTNGDWCHEVDGLGMHLGGQELANRIRGIAILLRLLTKSFRPLMGRKSARPRDRITMNDCRNPNIITEPVADGRVQILRHAYCPPWNGAARWDSNPDLRFWRPLFYH